MTFSPYRAIRALLAVLAIASTLAPVAQANPRHLSFPVAKAAMTDYAEEEAAGHPHDTYRIYNCRRRSDSIIWCAIRWRYPAARDEPGATGYYVLHTRTVARRLPACGVEVWEVLWEDRRCMG